MALLVRRVLLALIAILTGSVPAAASDLLTRHYTVADGLPINHTTAIVQDRDGLLWTGSAAGLARFDGVRFQVIGREQIRGEVVRLLAASDGSIVSLQLDGQVHVVRDGVVTPVPGPDGEPLIARDLEIDGERLLVISQDALWERGADGAWTSLVADEDLRLVRVGRPGELVLGRRGGWSTLRDGAEQWLDAATHPSAVAPDAEGRLWLVDRLPGSLKLVDGDTITVVDEVATTHIQDVVPLGDTTFVLHVSTLRALGARGGEELWDHLGGLDALVDRDGSLWIAGFEGLLQIPDPSLRSLSQRHGLPSDVVRYLARHGEDIWASTWGGTARVEPDGDVHVLEPDGLRGQLCTDGDGLLWTFATVPEDDKPGRRVRFFAYNRQGERVREDIGPRGATHMCGCDRGADGRVWLLGGGVLYRTAGLDQPPERLARTPVSGSGYNQVLETRAGELWVASRNKLCHQPAATAAAGSADWVCLPTDAPAHVLDLAESEHGEVWIATRSRGVGQVQDDAVVFPSSNLQLVSTDLRGFATSPRGGQWILGAGGAVRVRSDAERAEGWEVVERLPVWLSARISAVKDIIETEDGDLWIASHAGVQRVPASVRARSGRTLPIFIEEIRVDGVPRSATDGAVMLPGDQSTVRLQLSARTLLTPHPVRIRHRVDEGAWSEPSSTPSVELRGLPEGEHSVEVAASVDGHSWGPPRALRLAVPRPWWRRPWVWLVGLAAVAGAALLAQGIWARIRLREARARTRLAMDVHDELGAGLASLGLLGGLVEQGVDEARTRELGGRIAEDAEALGQAVSAMVWSLGPEHDSLPDLVAFLDARAASTLPQLHAAGAVHVDTSATPAGHRVDPETLRALQKIGVEALTNIARHAEASEVHLQIVRDGRRLGLQIRDDGLGFDSDQPGSRPEGGLGLRSMRERGRRHGLAVEVRSTPGAGTTVTAWLRKGR